jgi:hypothetical protein
VLVPYGAGDREARALVMTMEKLDDAWIWVKYGEIQIH